MYKLTCPATDVEEDVLLVSFSSLLQSIAGSGCGGSSSNCTFSEISCAGAYPGFL